MPHLSGSSQQVIKEYLKTETTQGEVSINLNLNLTVRLEQDGAIRIAAHAEEAKEDLDKFLVEIPDMGGISGKDLISFGEEVK